MRRVQIEVSPKSRRKIVGGMMGIATIGAIASIIAIASRRSIGEIGGSSGRLVKGIVVVVVIVATVQNASWIHIEVSIGGIGTIGELRKHPIGTWSARYWRIALTAVSTARIHSIHRAVGGRIASRGRKHGLDGIRENSGRLEGRMRNGHDLMLIDAKHRGCEGYVIDVQITGRRRGR